MKFGVITFPGSNCDRDLLISLEHNLGQEVEQRHGGGRARGAGGRAR